MVSILLRSLDFRLEWSWIHLSWLIPFERGTLMPVVKRTVMPATNTFKVTPEGHEGSGPPL